MTDEDRKLWEVLQHNPEATLTLVRNSVEFFAEGLVEPRTADIPILNRILKTQGKEPITAPDTSQWRLMVIENDGSDGEINSIGIGTLDEMTDINLIQREITQGDEDMAQNIITDLQRVGARYAEFIGGTVVLAAFD